MIQVLCNPVATQPNLKITLQNSFIDSSINKYTVVNPNVTNDNGIFNQSNGSGNFSTNSTNRSITIFDTIAGGNLVDAWNSGTGGTLSFWLKCGTNSGTSVSLITNLWGFSTNTWAFQIYISKNNNGNVSSINFRNSTNTTSFGTGIINLSSDVTNWIFVNLRIYGDSSNTYYEYTINDEIYTGSFAQKIQNPATTQYLIGRRTDDPANQFLNGNLSNYVSYLEYLTLGELKVLEQQKGRIK
jgi:hypothetical protein